MRIGTEHACSQATETRRSVASSQSDSGFAEALASASEASDATDTAASADSTSGPDPELSSATYRFFAAVAIERGDTAHANLFSARAADAREAGLPLHPAGVLSDTGRWDYTSAAAAIPETGHFDTASGQGTASFIPYNTVDAPASVTGCDPATDTAAATSGSDAASNSVVDRIHTQVARNNDTVVQALLASLAS